MHKKTLIGWLLLGLLLCHCSNMCLAGDLEQSQKNIITLIDSGQIDSAKTSIDKLLADFPQDSNLPGVIHKIANHYAFRGKISSARQLYSVLTTQFPQSAFAGKARMDGIRLDIQADIDVGNSSKATSAVEQVISNNSKNDYLPQTLYLIAGKYKKCNMISQAKSLYQRISELFPESEQSSKARIDVAKLDIHSLIVSGKYDSARPSIDKLISDNSKNEYLPSALFELADDCTKRHEYSEAKFLYERLKNHFPANRRASQATLEIAKFDIYLTIDDGNVASASHLLEKLIQDNQANSHLPKTLYLVAGYYAGHKNFKEGKALYNLLKSQYPDSQEAYFSLLDIAAIDIFSSINSGDYIQAKNLTDALVGNYSEHCNTPKVLYNIGRCYNKRRRYEDAKTVYIYLKEHYPQNHLSISAAAEISFLDICLQISNKDFTADKLDVYEQINGKIEDYKEKFKGYSRFTDTLIYLSEVYYKKGMELSHSNPDPGNVFLKKSLSILEKDVSRNSLNRPTKASVHYMIGLNQQKLGEYVKAADAFNNAAEIKPQFKYADYCVFAAGGCYEKLMDNKSVSETEAKPLIVSQYTKMLASYPHSEYASYAGRWLQDNK